MTEMRTYCPLFF